MRKIDITSSIPAHKTRKPRKRTAKQINTIVVHCTGSNNQDPNKTALYHVRPGPQNHLTKKGAPTLAYSDFITKDGTIYHCVDYSAVTYHAGLYNKKSIGVVLAFRGQTNQPPTPAQYEALMKQLVVLCLYFKVLPKKVIGHREVPGMFTILGNGSKKYKKSCPGLGINLSVMRHELTGRLQRRLAAEGLYQGAIDYKFGKQSKAALKAFQGAFLV